jgi:ribosomal protein L37E
MTDPTPPRPPIVGAISSVNGRQQSPDADKVLCERCGAEMYRMHAVWRCPSCGFKTDCCGW